MEEERMNTIKFCLKCGHPVGPEDKFCLGCGANIAEMQAQQSAGAAGDQPVQNTVNTQNTQNTVNTQNTQNTFQQPQQPQGFQQPQGQPGAAFQPQQNNFYAAQPQAGFGAPGAAVKKGDNWFAKNLKLIIIIAAALVLCIVGFFVIKHIFFRFQKIDAKDLIKVEFKGIESAGVATAKLNKYPDSVYAADGLTSALDDYGLGNLGGDDDDDDDKNAVSPYFEVGKKLENAFSKAGDAKEARKMRDALLSENAGLKILINGEEGNAKGLKNGDKVTIKLEFNESYLKDNNIKIENAEYEVEAEGLKTGTKVDLFKDVDVKFTGNDGSGYAQLDTENAQPFVRYTFKDTSNNRKLKNGDKMIVVARLRGATLVDESDPTGAAFLEYDGNYYTAEKITEEKEFTVSGLKEMTKVDIFEGIKIEYRYATPYLRAYKVNTDNCPDIVKNGVRFYIETTDILKIGDKIKVKAYPKNSFTEAGNVPDGTPDEDGYYVKEIEVGEDAPAYLTKETAPANSAKFNAFFEAATKDITTKGTDRTFISGFSAGGKITAMAFKETKTYLMENNEASTSSTKAYIAKTYTVTVTTDKGTKTAYGLIQLRNPIIEGGEAKVDMSDDDKPSYTAYIYEKEENVKSRLENLNRNYSLIDVAAAPATTEKPAETTTKAEDKKPEETTTTKAA